jgi:phosphoserine phosphatase RsbU/P
LNQAFQMERQNDLYFTIWYGVYHRPTGRLRYASAGHPSPILVSGARDQRGKMKPLSATGLPVGLSPVAAYQSQECTLAGPARLFLFSDGTYEIARPDGTLLEFKAFEEALTRAVPEGASELEELLHFAQEVHGSETLEDDFSIIKMTI